MIVSNPLGKAILVEIHDLQESDDGTIFSIALFIDGTFRTSSWDSVNRELGINHYSQYRIVNNKFRYSHVNDRWNESRSKVVNDAVCEAYYGAMNEIERTLLGE